jgi:hypothetical protein
MRGVTTNLTPITILEMHPMLFVDCPLCDAPAPLDLDAAALDCPVCAVRLPLAPDELLAELAAAA